MNEHQCPQNKSEWDTASQKLQCTDPNSYHCLRTEDGGETEQCLGKVWIQEGMCPEYNSKVSKIDVSSCKGSQGCPAKIYWSNEVYKYPSCTGKLSFKTTTASYVGGGDLPVTEQGLEVHYIIMISLLPILCLIVIGILIYMYLIRRKLQTQENASNENRQTPELSPLTVNDTRHEIQLPPERSPITDHDTRHEIQLPPERSPFTYQDNRHVIRQTPERSLLADYVAELDIDPHMSDVEDLEKCGVLILISSDNNEMGQRMKHIADSEIFGKSRYEHSLRLWEPEEDISLYLFRQPIDDLPSLMAISDKLDDMYKKVKKSPITYFVLSFDLDEWQKYQTQLLNFDFFNKAKRKTIRR